MKLSKKLKTSGSIFVLMFLLGGCSLLPNYSSEESNTPKKDTKQELERQEKEKQSQLEQLKISLVKQQEDARKEKEICRKMREDTEKEGKNPDDKKNAPKTVTQCEKAEDAENTIAKTKASIGEIEKDLREINDRITNVPSDKPETDNTFAWINLALLVVGGLLGIGLLAGLYYQLNKKIADESEANQQNASGIRKKHNELARLVEQLTETAKFQHEKLERQQAVIQTLQNQVKGGMTAAANLPSAQFAEPPQSPKPEREFPVSAENYLSKVRHLGQKATADVFGGLLIQDANKGEEFLIVKDPKLSGDLFYAVPSIDRFSTRKDYITYYQNYYACENPSGGTVWIVKPTVVRLVEGGWRLEQMGELEVRG